jgi:RNA polymerase sigma factor (sigma-70 family)
MAASPDTLLRYLHRLVVRPEGDEASDATLLGRFIAGRDERAFAALVGRHGPLVLHVCRRVLGNGEDAEDAFQATFLVLARKAPHLRHREALPAWLHGVAHRVALKARSARTNPQRTARPLTASPADPRPDPLAELSGRELLTIIDEELRRLAEVYRLPVILCCLEGRSLEEAARQLGWTLGSVKGRLERGRARLHQRLVRRGLTLSAALAAAELPRGTASAAEVARLAVGTVRGAVLFGTRSPAAAEGASTKAAALAGATLRDVALVKLKIAATLLLATCLLAAGFVLQRPAPEVPSSPLASADRMDRDAPATLGNDRPRASRDQADVPIDVRGRVLDPAGQPFAGAKLYMGYSIRRYAPPAAPEAPFRPTPYALRATSEADGQFHFAFARSELDARWLDERRPAVVAIADGYGPD